MAGPLTFEHEGTASPAGPDADRRAAPDAPARGGAAPDRRAPGATPLSRVHPGRCVGLVSRRRGRPSARRLPAGAPWPSSAASATPTDFGPTFAHQKLTEEHALVLSVETLRGWMSAAGLSRRTGTSPLVLGERDDAPLLGAVTLETLGLRVNPLTREVRLMGRLPMYRALGAARASRP